MHSTDLVPFQLMMRKRAMMPVVPGSAALVADATARQQNFNTGASGLLGGAALAHPGQPHGASQSGTLDHVLNWLNENKWPVAGGAAAAGVGLGAYMAHRQNKKKRKPGDPIEEEGESGSEEPATVKGAADGPLGRSRGTLPDYFGAGGTGKSPGFAPGVDAGGEKPTLTGDLRIQAGERSLPPMDPSAFAAAKGLPEEAGPAPSDLATLLGHLRQQPGRQGPSPDVYAGVSQAPQADWAPSEDLPADGGEAGEADPDLAPLTALRWLREHAGRLGIAGAAGAGGLLAGRYGLRAGRHLLNRHERKHPEEKSEKTEEAKAASWRKVAAVAQSATRGR